MANKKKKAKPKKKKRRTYDETVPQILNPLQAPGKFITRDDWMRDPNVGFGDLD